MDTVHIVLIGSGQLGKQSPALRLGGFQCFRKGLNVFDLLGAFMVMNCQL